MAGGTALVMLKEFRVVAGTLESAGEGNLCDAHGCVCQQARTDFQAVGIQEINGRFVQIFFEDPAAFAAAYAAGSGNIVQGKLLCIVLIYVRDHISLYGEVVLYNAAVGKQTGA